MADFQIWKLSIDAALAVALVYLGFRITTKSNSSGLQGKIAGLESSLRMLIQDADNAAQSLNDKLLKRKSSLEKLLFDLETVEQRLNRAITTAQEGKVELESEIVRAREAQRGVISAASGYETPRPAVSAQPQPAPLAVAEPQPLQVEVSAAPSVPEVQRSAINHLAEAYEPASFKKATGVEVDLSRSAHQERTQWQKVNIYGEPIDAGVLEKSESLAAAKSGKQYQPLEKSIEKEQAHSFSASSTPADTEIQRLYDSAENLLKTGRSLQMVAAETQLPIDEVRILSQMLDQEQASQLRENADPGDARLGVLGGITRRVQTL